jgi:hypothetical protein
VIETIHGILSATPLKLSAIHFPDASHAELIAINARNQKVQFFFSRIGIFGCFFISSYPQGYSFGFNSYLLTTKSDLLLEEGVRGLVE